MTKETLEPYNITRGEDVNIVLAFQEGESYVDLSTFTNIKSDFREGKDQSANLVFSKSLGSCITVSGTGNKDMTIALSRENTLLFEQGTYYFDIFFYVGAVATTWIEGTIIVSPNITA